MSNKDSYNLICDKWDEIRSQNPINTCIVEFASLLKPNSLILDIGCGTGCPIAKWLSDNDYHVIGIDVSRKMITKAQSLTLKNANFLVCDYLNFKINTKFDALIGFDSLFHIEQKCQKHIYPKANSLLKMGGYFLFTTGKVAGDVKGIMFDEEFTYGSLDQEQLQMVLKENGFEIVRFEQDYQEKTTGSRDLLVVARKIADLKD